MPHEHREYINPENLPLSLIESEWKDRLKVIDGYMDILWKIPADLDIGLLFAFTLDGQVVAGVGVGTRDVLRKIIADLRKQIINHSA